MMRKGKSFRKLPLSSTRYIARLFNRSMVASIYDVLLIYEPLIRVFVMTRHER